MRADPEVEEKDHAQSVTVKTRTSWGGRKEQLGRRSSRPVDSSVAVSACSWLASAAPA